MARSSPHSQARANHKANRTAVALASGSVVALWFRRVRKIRVTRLTSVHASRTTSGLNTIAPARVAVTSIVTSGTSPFHVELESREPSIRNRPGLDSDLSSEFHVERSARRTNAALTAASSPESQVAMPA